MDSIIIKNKQFQTSSMNQFIKIAEVNSADYLQVVRPSQTMQNVNEQQVFIHSYPRGENQPVQYVLQNNQQLQLFQLSSTQQQLIHGQTFIYQPIQVNTQVIVQPKQIQPMFININGCIMQIDSALTSKLPIVVTQSATTTTTTTTTVTSTTTATATATIVPNITTGVTKQFQQLPTTQQLVEGKPIYVNPKQYHRIMIRRQAREKLEAEGKIPITRKKRLSKSRCQYAKNQIRGDSGFFNSESSHTINMSAMKIKQNNKSKSSIIKDCYSMAINSTFDDN